MKITWVQFSALASWTAHRRASVSARSGEVLLVILAQDLTGTPRWFLATTAMAAWESDKAASTLSFIQFKGGDVQRCWECSDVGVQIVGCSEAYS